MSNKIQVVGRVNHRETLKHMILDSSTGVPGLLYAIREIISNSIDAGASRIRVFLDTKSKKFVVTDNGSGFDEKGLNSVLSYGFSSRDRHDITTIGTNGTGIKALLGLGDLDKTSIEILSKSPKIDGYQHLDIDFEYLVSIAGGKEREAEKHLKTLSRMPEIWNKHISGRAHGSTVILNNYDGRRIKSSSFLLENLYKVLTPRIFGLVEVYVDSRWKSIFVPIPDKEQISYTFSEKKVGNVTCDLVIGGSPENLFICGSKNQIMNIQHFSSTTGIKIPPSFRNVSGYIYLEKANIWRSHNGNFNRDFFSCGASDEFATILELIGDEIQKKITLLKQEENVRARLDLLRFITVRNTDLTGDVPPEILDLVASPVGTVPVGSKRSPKKLKTSYIQPGSVTLSLDEEVTVQLSDSVNPDLDFSGTVWKVRDEEILNIVSSQDSVVTIKGVSAGSTSLIAQNLNFEDGLHVIRVNVGKKSVLNTPSIFGPSVIHPGSSNTYHLKGYEGEFRFVIEKIGNRQPRGVAKVSSEKNDCVITASPECQTGKILLVARTSKRIIARKVLTIAVDPNKRDLVLSIGGKYYAIVVGASQDVIAYLLPEWASAGRGIPVIEFNPTIDFGGRKDTLSWMLEALAKAAIIPKMMHGDSEGEKLSYTEGLKCIENFVKEMEGTIYPKK